jgi:hypothetical protein
MDPLKIGGKLRLRREINNLAAEVLRNPTPEKKKRLEQLRQQYNQK